MKFLYLRLAVEPVGRKRRNSKTRHALKDNQGSLFYFPHFDCVTLYVILNESFDAILIISEVTK